MVLKKSFTSAILLFLIALSLENCTKREILIPKDRLGDGITRKYYHEFRYDKYGRPVFSGEIDKKLNKPYDAFYIVDYNSKDGTIKRSFQVAIIPLKDKKPELTKTLKTVYKWTGKGFKVGWKGAGEVLKASPSSSDAAHFQFLLAIGSIAGGTAGGFVLGILEGIAVTEKELEKPFTRYKELLIGYCRYHYDNKPRVINITQYTPTEKPEELIITNFFYKNNSNVPYRVTVFSKPEKRLRDVTFQ